MIRMTLCSSVIGILPDPVEVVAQLRDQRHGPLVLHQCIGRCDSIALQ